MAARDATRPRAVLFTCGQNAVRSPIAAALLHYLWPDLLVRSAGIRKSDVDPFAVAAMAELGLDIGAHQPVTLDELEDWEGLDYDLIITLAPEAHHRAMELTHRLPVAVEYWPTADPTVVEGNREQRLDAYRAVRDELMRRIRARFT